MAFITAEVAVPEIYRTFTTYIYYPTDQPEHLRPEIRGVITLLHGMGHSGAAWMNASAACRYAADNGYILVAPFGDNYFYTDGAYSLPFLTAITEGLPAQLRRIFNLPAQREKNFIAGASMGGYGAMLAALSRPDLYAAVGSFSGSLDFYRMMDELDRDEMARNGRTAILGPGNTVPPRMDLVHLAAEVAKRPEAQRPRIFCTVGHQDKVADVVQQNQHFRQAVSGLPLDYTLEMWDGLHNWTFWDRSLAEFIGFIQNDGAGARVAAGWEHPITTYQNSK
ncbi:MAG: prolyl oligopeptidase family serine peptidase [Ruminococcaceae bacterium]|nr:prolyl oligopeptidase family serine peptidase [Oscillospiraceae bacterium]